MEWLQQSFSFVFIVNLVLAGFLIFLERRNVAATWAWLMVLLFLPGIGFLIYMLFGQKLIRRKLYKLEEGEFSRFIAFVKRQRRQLEHGTMRFRDPAMEDYSDMVHMNLVNDAAWFTQNNEVQLFAEGDSKFTALLRDIRQAKDHIHLLYFIIKNDELGRTIVSELAAKAADGVEVRLLYDAIGSSRLPKRFFAPLLRAGGQAEAFFPTRFPFINFRLNFRNHRKLAIIDGQSGYIGGFNIGQEYVGKGRMGFWRDTHLRLTGNAVHMLQARFFLDWNVSSAKRMEELRRYFPPPSVTGKVGVQIVSSGPNSEKQQIKHVYLRMIYKAQKQILLQTPYFIPDDSMLTALKSAVMSGVDVRVMIPAKPDHKTVYFASYSYLGSLLSSGIRCYLYEKGFLHAKMMVVDGEIASVGSANLDIRSLEINFECNAILYDTATVSRLVELFETDLAHCREMTLEEYESRPIPAKLTESLMRLLSPIL